MARVVPFALVLAALPGFALAQTSSAQATPAPVTASQNRLPPSPPPLPPRLAEAAPEEILPVVIGASGQTRAVDCHGADLQVTGGRNTLDVRRCFTITLLGDGNHMRAQLLENSSISAPGNRNVVTFVLFPGASPRISATGLGNRINPEFSARDSQARPLGGAKRG